VPGKKKTDAEIKAAEEEAKAKKAAEEKARVAAEEEAKAVAVEEAKAAEAERARVAAEEGAKAAAVGTCRYCGGVDGNHRNGCPVATGKVAECAVALCPGCTFNKRPCPGPDPDFGPPVKKKAVAKAKDWKVDGKCRYCGGVDGNHRNGCPVATGKTAECTAALCPGCTFRGRPCEGMA